MTEAAARDRKALLRRETIASAVANAVVSIGFFLLVFAWGPIEGWRLAIDFVPQTFGITFLGGLVASAIMQAKLRKGLVVPAGPAPSRSALFVRILGYALLATPVLGGAAAALTLLLGPPMVQPATALIVKIVFGGFAGFVTTPPILRAVLGSPFRTRHSGRDATLVRHR